MSSALAICLKWNVVLSASPEARFVATLPPIQDLDPSQRDLSRFPIQRCSLPAILGVLSTLTSDSPVLHQRVEDALRSDPGLCLWQMTRVAIATLRASEHSCDCDRVISPTNLAKGIIDDLPSSFAATTSLEPHQHGTSSSVDTSAYWSRLDRAAQHFERLPVERWLEQAEIWFDAMGVKPPPALVSQFRQFRIDWSQSNPRSKANCTEDPVNSMTLNLARLASQQQHHRTLHECFDQSINRVRIAQAHHLAYGLSHELNNPLSVLAIEADRLRLELGTHNSLAAIQRQVHRAHGMLADLMFVASPPELQCTEFDLGVTVNHVFASASAAMDQANIDWRWLDRARINDDGTGHDEHPITIHADESLIGDAIAAVLQNAIESIQCDGRIGVRCQLANPNQVQLEIFDSGDSSDIADRRAALDPFFSGRESGRGLGLGLTRAARIVQLHDGTLDFLPGDVAGCCVRFTLPSKVDPDESGITLGPRTPQ
ncbi:MAG: HAMP domain-containing sensor histidine kinase [Planctomycetota bacterium]